MISVYDHTSYRGFLKDWIQDQPQSGRGQQLKLARAAGVSSTLMSLILKGDKDLSLDQANEISDHMGLNERESDFFFLLVQKDRAGSHKLKSKLEKKARELRAQAQKLSRRLQKDIEFTPEIRSIYYSTWMYTGLRNLIATEQFSNVQELAQRLHLPAAHIAPVVDFLLQHGLCLNKNGKLTYGPQRTHLEAESPHAIKHHQNWRLRGFQIMDQRDERDLFGTFPMSLSHEAAQKIRELLPKLIEDILKISGPSPSEQVACLNIDWFNYSR